MNLLDHTSRYWPYRWVPEIFPETAPIAQVECQHLFVELTKENRQRGLEGSGMAVVMEGSLIQRLIATYGFGPQWFSLQISKN